MMRIIKIFIVASLSVIAFASCVTDGVYEKVTDINDNALIESAVAEINNYQNGTFITSKEEVIRLLG